MHFKGISSTSSSCSPLLKKLICRQSATSLNNTLLSIQHKTIMFKTPDDFVIVHRARSGEPDFIYPCDERLAACIARSVNYSLGYLHLERVKNALVSYALGHSRSQPNAWYKDPVYGYKDINDVVFHFTTSVVANFFLICNDSTITNPDCMAFTANREWRGRFSPRDHCISVNSAVRERPSNPRPSRYVNAKTRIRELAIWLQQQREQHTLTIATITKTKSFGHSSSSLPTPSSTKPATSSRPISHRADVGPRRISERR